jgi:ADP-L-glycero-D-manno-heptose 6-epimerase
MRHAGEKTMYVVTGGFGFIGASIIKALNESGETDILVVDEPKSSFMNLNDCVVSDWIPIERFEGLMSRGVWGLGTGLKVIHQGAFTNTRCTDAKMLMHRNFNFSRNLLKAAMTNSSTLVYASSAQAYGDNKDSAEDPENERPTTMYGYSKLLFDQHVRKELRSNRNSKTNVVGLRYFNVYGPREGYKGNMASMPYQMHENVRTGHDISLFGDYGGYDAGMHSRDFVYVDDVAKAVMFFLDGNVSGIFNCGTGRARTFQEAAKIVLKSTERPGKSQASIKYINFPDSLKKKYQCFTQADLTSLRDAGYTDDFMPIEEGIPAMIEGKNAR